MARVSGLPLVMILDYQIPAHLEPRFLHGDVFLVEVSQAAQEIPQRFRRLVGTRRIDEVRRPFHVRFPALVLQYEHSAWRLARSSEPPLLCGMM